MELPTIHQNNNLLFPQSSSSILARLRQRWTSNATKIVKDETEPADNRGSIVSSPKFLFVKHRRDGPKSLDIPTLDTLSLEPQVNQPGSLSDTRLHGILKVPKKSIIIRSRESLRSLPSTDLKILEESSKKSNIGSQTDDQSGELIPRPPSSSGAIIPKSRNSQRSLENLENQTQAKRIKKVTFAAEVKEKDSQEKITRRRHIRGPRRAVKTVETEEDFPKVEEIDVNNFAQNLKFAFEPYLRPLKEQDLKNESIQRKKRSITEASCVPLPLELPPIKTDYEMIKTPILKNNLFALTPQARGSISSRERSNINFMSPRWAPESSGPNFNPESVKQINANCKNEAKTSFFSIFKKHGSMNSLWSKSNNFGH